MTNVHAAILQELEEKKQMKKEEKGERKSVGEQKRKAPSINLVFNFSIPKPLHK